MNWGRISRDLLWVVGGEAFYKAAGYAILFALARHLAPEELGGFFFAAALCSLAGVATELGTNTFVMRGISREPQRARESFCLVLSLRLPSLALALLAVNAFGALARPELAAVILLTSLSVLADNLYTSFGALFLGLRRPILNVACGVTTKTLLVVSVMLAVREGWPLERILLCYVATSLLQVALASGIAQRQIGGLRLVWRPGDWLPIVRESAPFFALALLGLAHFSVDTLMLGTLGTFTAVATYEVSFKLLEASRFLVRPVGAVIFPVLSQLAARGELRALHALGHRTLWAVAGVGVLLFAAIGGLAHWIVPLAFGDGYAESVPVLRILFAGVPLLFVAMVAEWFGNAVQREWISVRVLGSCVALNALLNTFAIPRWGPVGAAACTVISVSLLAGWLLHSHLRTKDAGGPGLLEASP